MDLPGVGGTSRPSGGLRGYTYKNLCNLWRDFLDKLNIEKAVFIGHDWGGSIYRDILQLTPTV